MISSIRLCLLATMVGCSNGPTEPVTKVQWLQSAGEAEAAPSVEPLEFMIAPWLATETLIKLYTPILKSLEASLDMPVRLNIAPDYPTLLKLIRDGKVHIAQVNARGLRNLLQEDSDCSYIATVLHETPRFGIRTASEGILIARGQATLSPTTVPTLRLGLVDKKSTSGYLFPMLWLKSQSIELDDFKDVLFLGSHTKVMSALENGGIDLGATWDGQEDIDRNGRELSLHAIASTGTLPNDAWVVAGSRGHAVKDQVKRWSTSLRTDFERQGLFESKAIFAGLKAIPIEVYQSLPKDD